MHFHTPTAMHDDTFALQLPLPQQKRCAWVALTQLPPHRLGQRRATQPHRNRLRAQRIGRSKHRLRDVD